MPTKRYHRILGIVLLLPLLGWALTGLVFFIKPGYSDAYQPLVIKTYPIDTSWTIDTAQQWQDLRLVKTILGTHLLVTTDGNTKHLNPYTLQVKTLPSSDQLTVLIEDAIYPELTEKRVQTKWIETENETKIVVPTIDAITGDKLTAFAPNTVGIPYFKGRDQQPFSMEICKQLFDLSKLFERIENMKIVAQSFEAFAIQEIKYRKTETSDLTPEKVLQDTIDTCLLLAKRGGGALEEKSKFTELQKGIKLPI
jgi:hypothetical protein